MVWVCFEIWIGEEVWVCGVKECCSFVVGLIGSFSWGSGFSGVDCKW